MSKIRGFLYCSLTANQILLGRSLVGRRRFDGLAVAVVVGGRRLRQRGRGGLLRICFSGDAVLSLGAF